MRKIINGNNLSLGVCYYPEHWEKEIWENDLTRMKENGIKTVRIGEFAWGLVEPKEGEYCYDLFEEFLDLAEKMDMQVIMCTPTATPPAWLTEKYPEVLNANTDGVLYRHGARRHYNYNSSKYQELSKKITEKYASHYAQHKAVIGWQLDNEFNCETCWYYSESDSVAFRDFLKEKYHDSLEELNKAWGTVFWSQTYTDWEQIYVPRTLVTDATNPHLQLDYIRFISDSTCKFAKMQEEIIRKYLKPDDFITTNGIFGNIDYNRMVDESLDFITYDSYPNFAYCLDNYRENDILKDRKWGRNLTEVRAISPVFGIMEQQSGANGWNTKMEAPMPRPGQMTLWTMQSIAHGADFVSYFRWRTASFGTEMYWHGILDYSGRDNRRLREVKAISEKLEKIQNVAGSNYVAEVAVLKDYDNAWDAQVDKWHERVSEVSNKGIFEAAQLTHTPLNYVYFQKNTTAKDLLKYKVIFYPHATILTEERMRILEEYVAFGGKLVMGCRTGYKDMTGRCVREYLPGLASKLTGTDIEEYTFVSPADGKVMVDWDGEEIEAAVFNDLLTPIGDGAESIAVYKNSYYKGTSALVKNRFGEGDAYYFGAAFNCDTAKVFLRKLGVITPYADIFDIPEDCELAIREKNGVKNYFILNYSDKEKEVVIKKECVELFSGEILSGKKVLNPYESIVLNGLK